MNCYPWIALLLSCSICYVCFRCRTVSVCRLLFGECTAPYWQLVWLVFMVVPLLFAFVCNFGFLAFYSKFVTTFPTGSAGRNSTYRFNPLSAVISYFLHVDCYDWYKLVSWFLLLLLLFNPLNGGKIMCFPKLWDLSDWLFWLQCVALISFVFCFKGFLSSVVSRSLRLDVLVMGESYLSASQFASCAFYNVKFLILSIFPSSCWLLIIFGNRYD